MAKKYVPAPTFIVPSAWPTKSLSTDAILQPAMKIQHRKVSIRPLKINCALWVTFEPFALSGRKTHTLYFMFNFSNTSISPLPLFSLFCPTDWLGFGAIFKKKKKNWENTFYLCHTRWCHTWCPSQTGAHDIILVSEKATHFFSPCTFFFASLARIFSKIFWLKMHNLF